MDQRTDMDILRYGLVLWRRKWIIAAVTIVALVAAFSATRLGPGAEDESEEAVVNEIYRASITVRIDSASALPSNPALSLLGIGDGGDRGRGTHVQLMRSRNVLERAAQKLRADPEVADQALSVAPDVSADVGLDEPLEPLSIAAELELEIDDLEGNVTVRSIDGTDLIEVIGRASDPVVAERRAEAIIAAYEDFLVDDEFGSIRDALETVKSRIAEIELATIVTPEVVTLLAILSREMDSIGKAVDAGAEDLLILESDISAAVRDSTGTGVNDAGDPGSLGGAERSLEILRATADAIRFASSEIDLVFEEVSLEEFDSALADQIDTLVTAAVALDLVSIQILEVQGQIAEISALVAEGEADEAMAENIGQFESANAELGFTTGLVTQVTADMESLLVGLTGEVNRLQRDVDPLQQAVDRLQTNLDQLNARVGAQPESIVLQIESLAVQIESLEEQIGELDEEVRDVDQQIGAANDLVARMATLSVAIDSVTSRFESVIETAMLSPGSESTRRLVTDEARAAGSSLTVIANEFVLIRRSSIMTVVGQGYLIAAESRLRSATSAMSSVTDANLESSVSLGAAQLLQIVQQMSAVAGASEAVVLVVEQSSGAGTAGVAERDLLTQHMQATSSTLRGVSAVIRNVRNDQLDGSVFAQLISAEAQIKAITDSLETSIPTSRDTKTVSKELGALQDELAGALTITDQLLARSESAIDTGNVGFETQRLMTNQIEAGAGILLSASDDLEDVRKLEVTGANAGRLISLEARLRGLSDGLSSIELIISARERLLSISLAAQSTAGLIRTVDAETELDVARDAVGEISNRLTVASTSMAEASLEVRELADRETLSGDSNLALVAQRVQSAGTRLATLTNRLPQIEGGSTADVDNLVTLRGELEILLLRPQETSITTIGTTVSLLPTGALLSIGGEAADLTFVLGGVAGLLLGVIAAIVLEAGDRSVKGPNDVKGIKGLVPLGVVARGAAKGNPHPPEVIDNPGSIFSESVQLLVNSIEEQLGENAKTVLVASPRAREGKTMLAINLARTFELRGKSALLIDANLRKPDASKIMEVLDNRGLANVLAGDDDAGDLVVRAEGVNILPAGSSEIVPVELISRREMGALLRKFERQYDIVVVDGPPILGFSDTTALAKQAGTAVIVVRAGKSKRDAIEEASEIFAGAGVDVIGAVVNFVKAKTLKHLAHDKYNRSKRTSKWRPHSSISIKGWRPRKSLSEKEPFSLN